MNTRISATRQLRFPYLLCNAALFTLFLFYIDEGYYNFNWMREAPNWFFFFIYTACIWGGEMLVFHGVLRKYHGSHKILASTLIGIPMGTAFIIGFFLCLKMLSAM